jgi:hypothetical protein
MLMKDGGWMLTGITDMEMEWSVGQFISSAIIL